MTITTLDPPSPGLLYIRPLSQNYLLARINMRSTAEPHSESAQLSQLFSPGCGYRECQHCAQTSPPPPPPLPPKPPWLRPSRPLSFSTSTTTAPSNISSLPVCDKIPPSETSASSETSEQEPVIYSKNVKLGHHDQSSQVNSKAGGREEADGLLIVRSG